MYGDLASFRTYHADRGNAAPTEADDTVALAAIVRASDYIEFNYVARLANGYDDTLAQISTATYIAAGLELVKPGLFSKTFTESERKVLTKVEGMQWTVTGSGSGIDAMVPKSTLIETLLRPYLAGAHASGGIVV